MKLWKIVLIALTASVISCGTYTKQPVASHIVAVTMQGDTILVAIDKIRPNMHHSYYPVYSSYNYYRPYYYNQPEYKFRYSDNRGSRGSNSGSKSGGGNVKRNPSPIKTNPVVGKPSSNRLMKGKN